MPEMKLQLRPTIAANIEQFTGRAWLLPTLLNWDEQSNEYIFCSLVDLTLARP